MAITLHDLSICLYLGGAPVQPPSIPRDLLDVPTDMKTPAIGRPFRVTRLAHVWAAMATRTCAEHGRYAMLDAAPFLTHLDDARCKGDAVANLMRLCPDLRPITAARVVGVEPMTVQRQIRTLDNGSTT